MRRTRYHRGVLVCLAMATLCPRSALADQEKDLREVRVLVDEGAALFRSGDFKASVAAFRRALVMYQDPDLLWNLARAYEQLGDANNASHYFGQLVRKFPDAPSVEKAKERIEKLKALLPGDLEVRCGGLAAAKVRVDGAEAGGCGRRISNLAPGVHVIEVEAPGYDKIRHEAAVTSGQVATVDLEIKRSKAPAVVEAKAAEGAPGSSAEAPPPTSGAVDAPQGRGPSWILLGGAGLLSVVAVGGLMLHFGATHEASQIRTAFETTRISDELARNALSADFDDQSDAAARWGTLAGISAAASAAVAGYALYAWSASDDAGDASVTRPHVIPLMGGAAVGVRGALP